MTLAERFISNIHQKNLFTKKDRLLIAVSGGVDSVVLCKLCQLAGFEFAIAHCNFQLRGESSGRDEAFVRAYAEELGVPFFSIKFKTKTFAEERRLSTQEAARVLRYEWFEKARTENKYALILTAHHADDNIETILMNFFRGTGIKGLTGIKEKNGHIIRPLLFAKRAELEAFLKEQQLSFVQDETNLQDDYTRNYFRNTILPLVAKAYPEVQENLLDNIERLKDMETLYNEAIAHHTKKLVSAEGDVWKLPLLLLQKQEAASTILWEILKPLGFTPAQLPEVMDLLQSAPGKYILSDKYRILKDRKHLIITPLKAIAETGVIIESDGKYVFANGEIEISHTNASGNRDIPPAASIACLDASKITYPLLLRPWRIGDYFYPLGMQKKKKLSRFFIDKKLSLVEKEKVWVLEMNKKIVWVVGHRIDDRFKILPATLAILKITWKANKS